MNKLEPVTARLTTDSINYINKFSDLFNVDKSTAFRIILQKGIEEDKKEKAIELYMKGKLTLESAAKFAEMYIGDFLELMKEKGVESNLTIDDFDETLKHVK